MTGVRRPLVTTLVILGLMYSSLSAAAPNPYGDSSSEIGISVSATGDYTVVHTLTQELRSSIGIGFGVVMSDTVRLPDDPNHPMPGLLRSPVTGLSGEFQGQEVVLADSSVGRRLEYVIPGRAGAGPGIYTAVLRYQRLAASVPLDDGRIATYVTLPDRSEVRVSTPVT